MFTLNIFDMITPNSLMTKPPISPSKIRTRRAKTVPPGPAMGPSMVHAERNIATVVTANVRANPMWPFGGQNGLLTWLCWSASLAPSFKYTTVEKEWVATFGSSGSGGRGGSTSSLASFLFDALSPPCDLQSFTIHDMLHIFVYLDCNLVGWFIISQHKSLLGW